MIFREFTEKSVGSAKHFLMPIWKFYDSFVGGYLSIILDPSIKDVEA